MSDFNIITLHITLEAANDPVYEPPKYLKDYARAS